MKVAPGITNQKLLGTECITSQSLELSSRTPKEPRTSPPSPPQAAAKPVLNSLRPEGQRSEGRGNGETDHPWFAGA